MSKEIRHVLIITASSGRWFYCCCSAGPAKAAGDITAQEPVDINVQLGNEKDALRFFLKLSTWKRGSYIG